MGDSENLSSIKDCLLNRIATSEAYFRSQQKGEKDLTYEEKRQLGEVLLQENVPLFLQRFHKYLKLDDLRYFEPFAEDYEVNFFMSEIRKQQDDRKVIVKVKNRRYEAMQRLIKEGQYFSELEMRQRSPHLYDQMIGQFQTEDEKRKLEPKDDTLTFSGFLMKTIENCHEDNTRVKQKEDEEAAAEEMDSDSSCADDTPCQNNDESESELEDDSPATIPRLQNISLDEKERLRQEFTNIMFEQFLSGNDQYDYSVIDDNADLDPIQESQLDAEEEYFDSEEPS